jgi:hypothetical protein
MRMQCANARIAKIRAPATCGAGGHPRSIVLDDHARLPWRFFGRLTAAVQAGL